MSSKSNWLSSMSSSRHTVLELKFAFEISMINKNVIESPRQMVLGHQYLRHRAGLDKPTTAIILLNTPAAYDNKIEGS